MAVDPRLLGLGNLSSSLFSTSYVGSSTIATDACATPIHNAQNANTAINAALNSTVGALGQFTSLTGGGGGAVGNGLRSLSSLSNTIRLAGNIAGTAFPATTSAGTNYVLNTVGIDPNQLNTASFFNPKAAAAAFTSGSQVYNAVKNGSFTVNNIPAVFSTFQNAQQLVGSLFTGSSQPQGSQFGTLCGASPYARDLIAFAPKYKFLFIVQIEFDPAFASEVAVIDPAFVVKSSTRPNIEFEYDEVNMYNFRTKVPKRTIYQPITMKFHDDDKNNALQFYTTYLKLMSPIANINAEQQKSNPLDVYDQLGGGMGFNFAPGTSNQTQPIQPNWTNTIGQAYAASIGPYGIDPSTRNILRKITLFHVYKQGRMMNVFNFYNPKITSLELDDVDMADSAGNEVSFQFSYDSVYVIPGFRIYNGQQDYDLNALTSDGQYPFGIPITSQFNDGGNSIEDGARNGKVPFGNQSATAYQNLPSATITTGSSPQQSSVASPTTSLSSLNNNALNNQISTTENAQGTTTTFDTASSIAENQTGTTTTFV